MHPISSASVESLPNELLLPILEACVVPSLFRVCKRWHHLLASEVMPRLYKQIGKMHVPQGNVKEQALIVDRIYKLEEKLSEAAKVNAIFRQIFTLASYLSPLKSKGDEELSETAKVNVIFRQIFNLASSFFSLKSKGQIEEKKSFTLANYSSYLLNINRLLLWKKLPGGEEYLSREEIKHLPLQKKGELLREWIEENCKNIEAVDLSGVGLTYLPSEICQLSKLQTLDLNQNQLVSLPAEIGQLSQLRALVLRQNQLVSLPAEIGQLSQLRTLNLRENQLTGLPKEIGQLSRLRVLYLKQNQLIALPVSSVMVGDPGSA
ncbi:hypothetical protein DB41_FX00210, partial [Neochlamydia sp. TUME1]|uniref:F-box/LRR-repeat protein n=1 Tax=Neochlamydia sp. TUME1 TaxID=1478174 RepID=UPI000582817E